MQTSYESILSKLYINTMTKVVEGKDKNLRSRVNLAIEEMSVLCNERDDRLNVTNIKAVLRFCQQINLDCNELYISSRITTKKEVIYTFKKLDNSAEFDIISEVEDKIVHVGILMDFENDIR